MTSSSRSSICLIRSQDTVARVGSNWTKSWFVARDESAGGEPDRARGISDELAGVAAHRHEVGGGELGTGHAAQRARPNGYAGQQRQSPPSFALTFLFIRDGPAVLSGGRARAEALRRSRRSVKSCPQPGLAERASSCFAEALAGLSAALVDAGLLSPLEAGFVGGGRRAGGSDVFLGGFFVFLAAVIGDVKAAAFENQARPRD